MNATPRLLLVLSSVLVAQIGCTQAQAPPVDETVRCSETTFVSNIDKPNYVNQFSGDVVLLWNFTEGGEWSISTCSEHTDFDTYLSLYDGSDPELTNVLTYNDDAGCAEGIAQSAMTGNSPAGVYYIVVEGFAVSVGNAEVSITCGTDEVDA